MDYVCRYGGEEFAVILPYNDKKEAYMIAERMRENIAKNPFVNQEVLPNKVLTVSVGVSTYPDNASNTAELIAYSDKALYEAKGKGKNTTCD